MTEITRMGVVSDQEIYERFQGKKLFQYNVADTKSRPTGLGIELLRIMKEQGPNDSGGRPWSDYFGFPVAFDIDKNSW